MAEEQTSLLGSFMDIVYYDPMRFRNHAGYLPLLLPLFFGLYIFVKDVLLVQNLWCRYNVRTGFWTELAVGAAITILLFGKFFMDTSRSMRGRPLSWRHKKHARVLTFTFFVFVLLTIVAAPIVYLSDFSVGGTFEFCMTRQAAPADYEREKMMHNIAFLQMSLSLLVAGLAYNAAIHEYNAEMATRRVASPAAAHCARRPTPRCRAVTRPRRRRHGTPAAVGGAWRPPPPSYWRRGLAAAGLATRRVAISALYSWMAAL